MTYEHVRATGAHEAALDQSDLFNVSFQEDDMHDFDTRWGQALPSANEVPKAKVVEILQVEDSRFCSASDRIDDVRSRKYRVERNRRIAAATL